MFPQPLPFRCPLCGIHSRSLQRMLSHVGSMHQYDANFFITCNIQGCMQGFAKFNSYRLHMYRRHRTMLGLDDQIPLAQENEEMHFDDELENDIEEDMFDVMQQGETEHLSRREMLQRHLAMFALKTREKHSLPKVVVQDIMSSVRFLVSFINESHTANHEGHQIPADGVPEDELNELTCNTIFDSIGSDFLLFFFSFFDQLAGSLYF